jgi:hypothetical protein
MHDGLLRRVELWSWLEKHRPTAVPRKHDAVDQKPVGVPHHLFINPRDDARPRDRVLSLPTG